MAKRTEFGVAIRKRLIDEDRTMTWLIEQVREKTGLYFDSSYLWKIEHGVCATPSIVAAIKEILEMDGG